MSAPHWHLSEWIARGAFILFIGSTAANPAMNSGSQYAESQAWPKIGLASWYSENDPGVNFYTASGDVFLDDKLTAAMWGVSFGSCVRVTNLKTLDFVEVRINDRGPKRNLVMRGRVIDLSRAAFERLTDLDEGLMPVQVDLLKERLQPCNSS